MLTVETVESSWPAAVAPVIEVEGISATLGISDSNLYEWHRNGIKSPEVCRLVFDTTLCLSFPPLPGIGPESV